MTAIQQLRATLSPEIAALNDSIAQSLQSPNQLLNTVVRQYLATKGKQIRPVLVILAAQLFGRVNDKTIACAAAVEILHNSSLIHDDVVDDSDLRRGHPTVNNVWDNRISVLVGDYFIATSLRQAISTGIPRIIEVIGRLGELLTLGELDQIYTARRHQLSIEDYFTIIDHKTASLFEACVEVGARSVEADEDDIQRLMTFAHILGECFQIRDDIFDYFPTDEALGKPTGNDLREGKVTLPLLYALIVAEPDERTAEMKALIQRDELSEADIATLTAYARQRGGIDYAFDTMRELQAEALETLGPLAHSEAGRHFADLLEYTVKRQY